MFSLHKQLIFLWFMFLHLHSEMIYLKIYFEEMKKGLSYL
jgi:hypothetical protein